MKIPQLKIPFKIPFTAKSKKKEQDEKAIAGKLAGSFLSKQEEKKKRKKEKESKESPPVSLTKLRQSQKKIVIGARTSAFNVFKKMRNQFSDPNKLYRELVQNAMDAGTDRMYFTFEQVHLLQGQCLGGYVDFFADRFPPFKEEIQKLSGERILSADARGEVKELQKMLGVGYAGKYFFNLEHSVLLREEKALDYVRLVSRCWKEEEKEEEEKEKEKKEDERDKREERKQIAGLADTRWGKLETLAVQQPVLVDKFFSSEEVLQIMGKNEQKKYQNALGTIIALYLLKEEEEEKKDPVLKLLHHYFWTEYLQQRHEKLGGRDGLEELQPWGEKNDAAAENFALTQVLFHRAQRLFPSVADTAHGFVDECKEKLRYHSSAAAHERSCFEKPFFYGAEHEKYYSLSSFLESAPTQLTITVEDFGRGMTHAEREQFLKRIFSSSKTDDLEQTGRFGVGVLSIWALHPEKVIYESVRAGEAWEYHFLQETEDSLPGELYIPEKPRERGTKITIVLPIRDKIEITAIVQQAEAHLRRDCRHIEKAIYFNGRTINESFDLPECPVRVHFGKRGVEGVIGLSYPQTSTYILENNRIVLEQEKENLLFISDQMRNVNSSISVLVSSQYLNYDIGRKHVERDVNFNNILRLIKGQRDALAVEALNYVNANHQQINLDALAVEDLNYVNGNHQQRNLCWNFLREYFATKELLKYKGRKLRAKMAEISPFLLDTPVAEHQDGTLRTLRQVLTALSKQRKPQIYFCEKKNDLSASIAAEGKEVYIVPVEERRIFLSYLGSVEDIEKKYKKAEFKADLLPEEEYFVNQVRKKIRRSTLRLYLEDVVISPDSASISPFYWIQMNTFNPRYYQEYRWEDRKKIIPEGDPKNILFMQSGELIEAFSGTIKDFLWGDDSYGKRQLAIDVTHPYVRELILDEHLYQDGYAVNIFLQHVASSQFSKQKALRFTHQLLREEKECMNQREKKDEGKA